MKRLVTTYFALEKFPATSVATELRAGVATFVTMSYILLVNPQLLGAIGVPAGDVVLATALSSALATLLTSMMGNLPFGLAPGMGLSAYLAFGLVQQGDPDEARGAGDQRHGLSVAHAFTCAFYAGVLLVLSAVSGISTLIMKCTPRSVKLATVTGMGLLIALIGMKQVALVVPNGRTLVALGDLTDSDLQLCLVGVLLTGSLLYHKVPGAILLGIATLSVISWTLHGDWPGPQLVSVPRPTYALGELLDLRPSALSVDMVPGILGFLFVGIFDVSGIIFGMARLAGLEGGEGQQHVPGDMWVYLGASLGTMLAAGMGSSPIIVHVESAAGIQEGGRTGLTSLVVALLFVGSIFVTPLLAHVPPVATSPVLIIIGAMMMGECVHIDWREIDQALPAFLTLIMMPFTFSIADGVACGIAAAALLRITTGACWRSLREWRRGCPLTVRASVMASDQTVTDNEQQPLLVPSTRCASFFEQLTMDNGSDAVERSPRLLLASGDLEKRMPLTRSSSLPHYGTNA